MNEPRDTIPFPIGQQQAAFEPGDGITVATDFSGDQYEATYSIDGQEICVAYVDDQGKPRVDFHELTHVGLAEFKRCLTVWVMSWAHAQELSVLWRIQGGDHAG